MDQNDRLKPIRVQLRRMMNGVVSSAMRKEGADYALNFGVSLPQLKQYAETLEKDESLADILWEQRAREMKILACMLHPFDSFTEEKAQQWIKELPNVEISRVLSFYLLQHMPYAEALAVELIQANSEEQLSVAGSLTGYSLLTRLSIKGEPFSNVNESLLIDLSVDAILQDKGVVQEAAATFLKRWSSESKQISNSVRTSIEGRIKEADQKEVLRILEDIVQEIEFIHG